jgi:hypothetical protein
VARVLLAVVFTILLAAAAGAVTIKWASLTNPSNKHDSPLGICVGSDYVYVVGYDFSPGDSQWRIEKRSKADGRLLKTWTKNPTTYTTYNDLLSHCVVVGDKLYVLGDWALLSFDLDLNLLKQVSNWYGWPSSVFSDGKYLYIASWEYISKDDTRWRVEKRRLDDLSLVASYTSNPSDKLDDAEGIGINPATGHLWVVGLDGVEGQWWRIEVLDRDLNRLLVLRPGVWGWAWGVVFDENGNAYVYGTDYVIKYSKDGKELARAAISSAAEGAVYMDGKLYVVTLNYRLIVFDADLRKLDEVDLTPEITKRVEVGEFGVIDRVAFDGGTIYVAGYAKPKGASDVGWLVFAVQLAAPVSLVVVDGFGSVRNWKVEILDTNGRVVASGFGKISVELPEGVDYTVRVYGPSLYTTRITAREGEVKVQVPTGRLSAVAVDGFGRIRNDWSIEIEGVASGYGAVGPVEVLAGRYLVKTKALGREFTKEVEVGAGNVVEARVEVPTATITAVAVDGFGRVREWVVEVVGLASGSGRVGPVEVLAGRYTVKTAAFGREFTKEVEVKPGVNAEVRLEVPTAVLDVVVAAGGGATAVPEAVFLNKTRLEKLSGVEVLAGRYIVEAVVGGRTITEWVELKPGTKQTIRLTAAEPTTPTSTYQTTTQTQAATTQTTTAVQTVTVTQTVTQLPVADFGSFLVVLAAVVAVVAGVFLAARRRRRIEVVPLEVDETQIR